MYRGYEINCVELSGNEYYYINYEGSDVVFDSEEDAMLFIDCVG